MRGLAERGRQIEGWFAVSGGHVGMRGQIKRICICRLCPFLRSKHFLLLFLWHGVRAQCKGVTASSQSTDRDHSRLAERRGQVERGGQAESGQAAWRKDL